MSDYTKVCCRCGERKATDEFGWKNKGLLVRLAACRQCRSIETKAQYKAKSTPEWRKKDKQKRADKRESNGIRMYDYFLSHPCSDCGESNPLVLEFHHTGNEKNFNVGEMLSTRLVDWDDERIQNELSLCEVICANCHKKRTHRERQTARYREHIKRQG